MLIKSKIRKMQRHPFIKFITLTIIYAVVILGIFILQFKTDTSITRAIGDMRISLDRVETEDENPETELLKNQLAVSFKGLSFSANDSNPAIVSSSKDEKKENLVLESWDYQENSARFNFTDGTSLVFAVMGTAPDNSISVTAIPAEGFDTVSIPYSVASSYKIASKTDNSITVESKENTFVFAAHQISNNRMVLSQKNLTASFAPFVPEKIFEYKAVAGNSNAADSAYTSSISKFRKAVVSKFTKAIVANPSAVTELQVISYVAEMGSQGKFMQAVNEIPASFKNSANRTYLSTPYFGNLVGSNPKLIAKTNSYSSLVNNAVSANDISVFTEDGIAEYILRERKNEKIKTLMQIPSKKVPLNPTITDAAGILSVYSKVRKIDETLASSFDSVLNQCLDVIAMHLKLEDDKLLFINRDDGILVENLTTSEKIRIGQALVDFARSRNKNEYAETGRMIINQELESMDSFELDTIAELYPVIVTDNKYYPHSELLGYYGNKPVWAWTCASSISYRTAPDGVVSINLEFPLENSQYVIITGVPTFHSQIEIQKLRFRTDPKFETYNSSGYAYDESNNTLFLKSRHKSKNELIRLFCDPASNFAGPDDTIASMQQQVQELGLANVSVKKTDEGLTLSVEKIQFEAESATLRPSEFAKIEQIAQILKAYPDNDIMVSGHTAKSNIGRPAQPLSEERAEAVADYLVELGVRTRDHIFTQGFGDTRPISPNDTEEERSVNRRVEITIMNK